MSPGHPRMIDPDDPFVVKVRAQALLYPDASERESWGRPSFRTPAKTFLLVSNGEAPHALIFRPEPGDAEALRQDDRFWSPPYWGASGWLAVDGDDGRVSWRELCELIDASYRVGATKRQLAAVDAEPVLR